MTANEFFAVQRYQVPQSTRVSRLESSTRYLNAGSGQYAVPTGLSSSSPLCATILSPGDFLPTASPSRLKESALGVLGFRGFAPSEVHSQSSCIVVFCTFIVYAAIASPRLRQRMSHGRSMPTPRHVECEVAEEPPPEDDCTCLWGMCISTARTHAD